MSDLRTLHDAFAELDRRADTLGTAAADRAAGTRRGHRRRGGRPGRGGGVAGAGRLRHVRRPAALSTTTARGAVPTSPDDLIARFGVVLGDTATFEVTQKLTVPRTSPSQQPGSGVTKLDGTDGSAFVVGTLASAGVTGSFSLTIDSIDSEPGGACRNSHPADCVVSTLPDGSRLATETARLAPGAVSYMACHKRLRRVVTAGQALTSDYAVPPDRTWRM